MPELPEVETVVRALRPKLVGRAIQNVWAGPKKLRVPWKPLWNRRLKGRRIVGVRRRAKWILIDLDRAETLIVHLGMTGRLQVTPAAADREAHTHFIARLSGPAQELRFHDARRFGLIQLYSDDDVQRLLNGAKLGPEPWELDSAWLAERIGNARRCLKACLLDQSLFAGVGNIYADEALFEAHLAPQRLACRLQRREVDDLRRAVVKVLDRAIGKNGSTIRSFFYGDGQRGAYQNEFRVYQQAGRPCRRCRTPILQIRLAGRATHYCPRCQRVRRER